MKKYIINELSNFNDDIGHINNKVVIDISNLINKFIQKDNFTHIKDFINNLNDKRLILKDKLANCERKFMEIDKSIIKNTSKHIDKLNRGEVESDLFRLHNVYDNLKTVLKNIILKVK